MKYSTEDPIVALASPPVQSAIAIVRTSGRNSLSILSGLFKGKEVLDKAEGHTLHYGIIYNPDTGEKIDKIIIGVYRSPSSYTGEDGAELFCHGNMTIIKKIVMLLENNVL